MKTENKEQEIIEGNKLIAEFMGASEKGFSLGFDMSGNEYFDKSYIYHSSWDWLMPVWYKFRGSQMAEDKKPLHNNFCARIAHSIAYGEIHEAHDLLCNSIKWYNSNLTN